MLFVLFGVFVWFFSWFCSFLSTRYFNWCGLVRFFPRWLPHRCGLLLFLVVLGCGRKEGCCGGGWVVVLIGCSVSVCRRAPEIHKLPTLFLVVGVMVVLLFVVAVLLRLKWVLGSVPLCIAQLTMHVWAGAMFTIDARLIHSLLISRADLLSLRCSF